MSLLFKVDTLPDEICKQCEIKSDFITTTRIKWLKLYIVHLNINFISTRKHGYLIKQIMRSVLVVTFLLLFL